MNHCIRRLYIFLQTGKAHFHPMLFIVLVQKALIAERVHRFPGVLQPVGRLRLLQKGLQGIVRTGFRSGTQSRHAVSVKKPRPAK